MLCVAACGHAGDDYDDPDCSSADLVMLDLSHNALAGTISSGAVQVRMCVC